MSGGEDESDQLPESGPGGQTPDDMGADESGRSGDGDQLIHECQADWAASAGS